MVDRSELMKAIQSFMENPERPTEALDSADEHLRMTRPAETRIHAEDVLAQSLRAGWALDDSPGRPEGPGGTRLSEAYCGAVGSSLYPHWTVVPPCSLNSEAHG